MKFSSATGEKLWIKEYEDIITSIPSFTDRSIIFSIANSFVAVTDPADGSIQKKIDLPPKSGPLFVTIRDQIYVAYNEQDTVKEKIVPYGILKAEDFSTGNVLWSYKTPFPGAVSQPIASNGIMFFPSGNYLYAIGTEYYARIIEGGSGRAVLPDGFPAVLQSSLPYRCVSHWISILGVDRNAPLFCVTSRRPRCSSPDSC